MQTTQRTPLRHLNAWEATIPRVPKCSGSGMRWEAGTQQATFRLPPAAYILHSLRFSFNSARWRPQDRPKAGQGDRADRHQGSAWLSCFRSIFWGPDVAEHPSFIIVTHATYRSRCHSPLSASRASAGSHLFLTCFSSRCKRGFGQFVA